MTTGFPLYRGLEVYPLVYPHRATEPGNGHSHDEEFDAAVRIREPGSPSAHVRGGIASNIGGLV